MGSFEKRAPKFFLSAGEASGDLHGAELVREMRAIEPGASISCLGGPCLRDSGAAVLVDNRDIAVVGITEVFRHLKDIHAAWKRIKDHLLRVRPDLVILIDFPDFNFLVGRMAKRLGLKVFYYISPQVWAWRRRRVYTLKRLADRMAVILPFEPDFYAAHGMKVDYVGHPLLDVLTAAPSRQDARERYGSGNGAPLVGLLPGSRRSEIRLLLSSLMEAASIIQNHLPDARFIVPVAPGIDPQSIDQQVQNWNLPVRLVSGDTYGVIRACDLIITASGTVTLEAAVLGTPMIIIYKLSRLSYRVGKLLIKVTHAGLPNLISGRGIVPELIQDDACGERIAAEAMKYLRDRQLLDSQRTAFTGMRNLLGGPGVSRRVAAMVLEESLCRPVGPVLHPVEPVKGAEGGHCFPFWQHLCSTGFGLAWPGLLLYYFLRSRTDGKYRENFRYRMGLEYPDLPLSKSRVWVHALSVGETLSSVPLVRSIKEFLPSTEIVFSTATEAGQAIARKRLAPWVQAFFYLPHDFPWAVDKLVRKVGASLFFLIETDVWPGLLCALNRHGTKTFLANGRISEKSFARLRQCKGVVRGLYCSFEHIFAQSKLDKIRYEALGVPGGRVTAAGNLKFESSGSMLSDAEAATLRENVGVAKGRLVWVAGSTHDGEEEDVLKTFVSMRGSISDLLLVIAPRQVQRAPDVLQLCKRYGLSAACRSKAESAQGKAVYIVDTLGELSRLYALADVAFVGGSLIPFGGHNPLEPVAQGKPVVWGPHLFNFREIEASLLDAVFCQRVESWEQLEGILTRWLCDSKLRQQARSAATRFVLSESGASGRIALFAKDTLL